MSQGRPSREAIIAALRPELDALEAEAEGQLARLKRRLLYVTPLLLLWPLLGLALIALPGGILSNVAPLVGFFALFAIFLAALLYVLHDVMGFVLRSRQRVAKGVGDLIGFSHGEKSTEQFDFSAFSGTPFGKLLRRSEAVNVLTGVVGDARVQIFDAKVKSPASGSKAGEAARMMTMVRVARMEVAGRWTGRTVVLRDAGMANGFSMREPDMKRVGFADRRFEDLFEAYSNDQVEARTLLHPVFMERLMALEDLFADQERAPVAAFADGAFMIALAAFGPQGASAQYDAPRKQTVKVNAEKLVDEVLGVLAVAEVVVGDAPSLGQSAVSP